MPATGGGVAVRRAAEGAREPARSRRDRRRAEQADEVAAARTSGGRGAEKGGIDMRTKGRPGRATGSRSCGKTLDDARILRAKSSGLA